MFEMIKNVCTVIVLYEVVVTFVMLITIVMKNRKDRRNDNDDEA